jgi:hypothetical protein
LIAVAIVGLWVPGLASEYRGTVDEAENPLPMVEIVRSQARPGDALAYGYVWQVGYLLSYCPSSDLTFYRAHYTPQTVGPELTSIFSAHPRLWLLDYRRAAGDPANLPGSWLEAEAYRVESGWYGDHHLALYLDPATRTAGVGPEEGAGSFDGRIELRYPLVDARLGPGDVLALPLRWRALVSIEEDYQAFVHLGKTALPPAAQSDGAPRNGLEPTCGWVADKEVVDRRALPLPETIEPGTYRVTAGLYRLADGKRLPVDGADELDGLVLGYVEIVR